MGTLATVRLIEGVRLIRCPRNTGFTVFGCTICNNFHGSVVSVKSAVSYSKLSPAACECCNNYWHQTDTEQYSKGCSLIFPWMNFYFYLLVFDCTFYKMKLRDKIEQHNIIIHNYWSLHTFRLLYNQINCFKFNW